MGGRSIAVAARQVGVNRMTIHRWIRSHSTFQAAFNAWQDELRTSARARLLGLCDRAVDVVEDSLTKRNTKTALTVLKATGVLNAPDERSSDAQDIARRLDFAQREHKLLIDQTEETLSKREDLAEIPILLAKLRADEQAAREAREKARRKHTRKGSAKAPRTASQSHPKPPDAGSPVTPGT